MPSFARDFRGTIDREEAAIGALISFQQPSAEMRREAAEAGFYLSPGWGKKYPRIRLLTVEQLLSGAKLD